MFDAYAVNGIIGMFFCIFVTLFGHYVVLQMFVAVLTFTLQQVLVYIPCLPSALSVCSSD